MPKTVVGIFDTFSQGQGAVQDLMRFGVRREDISLVARDEHGNLGESREVAGTGGADGASAGAVGGSLVGGALGLLIGTGLLVIPGIGPVLAAGPLAAAVGSAAATVGATALGAGIGAAAGGLLGGLMGAGIPEEDARAYVEGVRRGGTLISVSAADTEVDDVRQILIRNGAIDLDARATEWRAAGWDATAADAYAAGNVSMGSAAIDSSSDAYTSAPGIPRGESYAIRGRDYAADPDRAGTESGAAGKGWADSSKLGTVGGSLAGAATGAAIGAAGGPAGAVVGGIAGAATGAGVGAAGDVAGERLEPAAGRRPDDYAFRDDENLADAERKVVDSSYTNVDRTGERVKSPSGFASGHTQPFEADQAQFSEFANAGEGNFRTEESTIHGDPGAVSPARDPAPGASDADVLSESTRRAPHFAGADAMGGAVSGMQGGSGSEQPGAFSSTPGRPLSSDQRASLMGDERNAGAGPPAQQGARLGPRIYDRPGPDPARAGHEEAAPSQGDFARGMREETPSADEPDYARGLHDQSSFDTARAGHEEAIPPHGDFARGMREETEPTQPDYARGQREYDVYDADFYAHYQSLTGSGGQPYDYYKPGYQFGYDLGNDRAYSHDTWSEAEADARQRWEREARGSWEEFRQAIHYGWEKARGRA